MWQAVSESPRARLLLDSDVLPDGVECSLHHFNWNVTVHSFNSISAGGIPENQPGSNGLVTEPIAMKLQADIAGFIILHGRCPESLVAVLNFHLDASF